MVKSGSALKYVHPSHSTGSRTDAKRTVLSTSDDYSRQRDARKDKRTKFSHITVLAALCMCPCDEFSTDKELAMLRGVYFK